MWHPDRMATAATSGHRGEAALRASLVLAALILFGTASWFAASWVDSRTYDITCGSVFHSDIWLHSRSCQRVMVARGTISTSLVAGGGVLLYLGLRRRPVASAFAIAAVAISVVSCGAILIVNEAVRSGGGL